MKYFVEIAPSNKVINKVVTSDDETEAGIKKIMKSSNTWKEVPKSGGDGVGGTGHVGNTWDPTNNVFIGTQPYPSWQLNNSTFRYDPPVPKPADTGESLWVWDEDVLNWVNEAPPAPTS
jgi:hypothetical protein